MKLYQLIKDLQGEGATKALTHLITLDTLITQLENYVSESDGEARAWDLTVQYKDALKEPVSISMFDKQKGTLVFFKGFKKDGFFGGFINNKYVRAFPSEHKEDKILIYGKKVKACHTLKELAEVTQDNPFELEIRDPEI